mgnify:CR=1 FL=1
MFNIPINDENFMFYASQIYDNPQCMSEEEFEYIKRLFYRYDKTGELKLRLILNHIIILNNVFGSEGCSRLLFYKIDEKYYAYLKSFLRYLEYLPKTIPELDLESICADHRVDEHLERL